MEEMYLNIIKVIWDKSTANILNGENLKAVLPGSETRWGYPFLPLLFNIVLEFLARAAEQEKERKDTQTGKEEVKQSLFADDMVSYIENPEDAAKKLLETINMYSKAVGDQFDI